MAGKNPFIDSVLNHLTDHYIVDGKLVDGQAISFLAKCLREDGYVNLSNLADLESELTDLGFEVRNGRNRRGNNARVVYL